MDLLFSVPSLPTSSSSSSSSSPRSPEASSPRSGGDRRSSAPPSRSVFAYAFDRWLAVVEPEADEFVLA
jgi:hypothetical protein